MVPPARTTTKLLLLASPTHCTTVANDGHEQIGNYVREHQRRRYGANGVWGGWRLEWKWGADEERGRQAFGNGWKIFCVELSEERGLGDG